MPPAPSLPWRHALVTGGGGFVGRHLVAALTALDGGARVTTLGRAGDRTDVIADLVDPAAIAVALRQVQPDIVFHLAGEASVAAAGRAAAATWRVNLCGTLAIAATLAEVSPEATMMFASSSEVYGRAFLDGTVTEETRPEPTTVYAQSKLAAEQMLAAVLPPTASLIIARPANHIGPGQHPRFAIPSFAEQLIAAENAGTPAVIRVGNLTTERDFMDVRDVVYAYIELGRAFHGKAANGTFNIASGQARPIRAMLDGLRAEARIASTVEVDPERLRADEIARASIDAGRLREAVGWRPVHAIGQSLRDVLQAARDLGSSVP